MKLKSIYLGIIVSVYLAITVVSVYAATPIAEESTPSALDKLKKIEVLKEKIATKVAELREKEQGGIAGIIKSIEAKQMILTQKGEEKITTYSEDTSFYQLTTSGKTEILDIKKLETGDSIAVLGYFDDSRVTLSAKYIFISSPSARIIGKIADIDKSKFTITVKENQGDSLIDIETYSKLFTYSKGKGLIKAGFSKLAIGDTVHIAAIVNPKEENRYSALRLYAFTFKTEVTPAVSPTLQSTSTPSSKPKATIKPTT